MQHENIWLFAWADFRVIYSDKETREEEEEEGKNIRIPARAILSCAWSDIVSGEKAHTWREQMSQWETVLTFVSMVIILSSQGCISFLGGTHKGKHAQQNSTNKHLEDHAVEFWKSCQYCGKINSIMNSQLWECFFFFLKIILTFRSSTLAQSQYALRPLKLVQNLFF